MVPLKKTVAPPTGPPYSDSVILESQEHLFIFPDYLGLTEYQTEEQTWF